jgi:hypothetical protein
MHHLVNNLKIEFQIVQNYSNRDSNEFQKKVLDLIKSIESLILLYCIKNEKTSNVDDNEFVNSNNDYIVDIIVNLSDLITLVNFLNSSIITEANNEKVDTLFKYCSLIINFAEKTVRKIILLIYNIFF